MNEKAIRGGAWCDTDGCCPTFHIGYKSSSHNFDIGFRALSIPTLPAKAKQLRGGSWLDYQGFAHADYRGDSDPRNRLANRGFRVVCSSPHANPSLINVKPTRGGSWFIDAEFAHSTCRYWANLDSYDSEAGFRILSTPPSQL